MREIRIRQMRYEDARMKLENELNDAFMRGESRVRVIHGVGTGQLKQLVHDVVAGYDFCRIVEDGALAHYNPGTTTVDVLAPDRATLRLYRA